jgi:hypothetical protein
MVKDMAATVVGEESISTSRQTPTKAGSTYIPLLRVY